MSNLIALLVIPALTISMGGYINANMPYLLQDPYYFNVSFGQVGTYTGTILFVSSFTSTILTPFMGYAYDIVGRKGIIITCIFILAVVFAFLPFSAPFIWLLIIFRTVIGFLIRFTLSNPLVLDYIRSESRGLGMGLITYGFVFGKVIFISMFEATRKLSMT